MKTPAFLLIILSFFISGGAFCAPGCPTLEKDLTDQNTLAYQKLVQGAIDSKMDLKSIIISRVLREKDWLMIFMSTDISEPGVMFFNDNKFVDVWGGMIDPDIQDDKAAAIRWARNHRLPPQLERCFLDGISIK